MSTARLTHDRSSATVDPLPTSLDSSDSKLVYLYLATVTEATIADLRSTLDVQQLALFPVLETLESKGLIERTGETFSVAA